MESLFDEFEKLDVGRYIVRKIDGNDYEGLFSIYGDEDIMKYDKNNLLKSVDEAKNIYRGILNKWFIRWAIIDTTNNEFIGTIALHHFDFEKKKVQIGYNLKKSYWKKGIMSNILIETIEYLRLNTSLETIEASIYSENIASVKLAEKVGFTLRDREDEKLVFAIEVK